MKQEWLGVSTYSAPQPMSSRHLVDRPVEQHVVICHVEMAVVVDPTGLDPHHRGDEGGKEDRFEIEAVEHRRFYHLAGGAAARVADFTPDARLVIQGSSCGARNATLLAASLTGSGGAATLRPKSSRDGDDRSLGGP